MNSVRKYSVLALVGDAFGGRGGIAQYNRDFLGSLAGQGAVSSIIVLPRHAPDPATTPHMIAQTPPHPGRLAYALAALRAAFTRHVDIVFCGHLYMAPLALLIARLKRAKLIMQMHGIEAWPRPAPLHRAAVEAADLILCVSRHTRASVLGWATIAPERVLVLPNTVSESFTPGDGSRLRAALGLDGKRVLLTVGRMDARERYKGHDRVIAALPKLIAESLDVVYVIIGEGDDIPRLQTVAEHTGVSDRVRFLGAVKPETLIEAYRMADLFVMPSTREGFGIAFLEAMACGTPALGLAIAGACDALADGELGTAVVESEFEKVVAAILGRARAIPAGPADAVHARFGRKAFAAGARAAIDSLVEAA